MADVGQFSSESLDIETRMVVLNFIAHVPHSRNSSLRSSGGSLKINTARQHLIAVAKQIERHGRLVSNGHFVQGDAFAQSADSGQSSKRDRIERPDALPITPPHPLFNEPTPDDEDMVDMVQPQSPEFITEANDEMMEDLVNEHVLPDEANIVRAELKEEISRYASGSFPDGDGQVTTPEQEVAKMLVEIGDEVQKIHFEDLTLATNEISISGDDLNYEMFKYIVINRGLISPQISEWKQIALLLLVTQKVSYTIVNKGQKKVAKMADYATRLLKESAATFIIEQGGWGAVTKVNIDSLEPTPLEEAELVTGLTIVDTTESLKSLAGVPPDNTVLEHGAMLRQVSEHFTEPFTRPPAHGRCVVLVGAALAVSAAFILHRWLRQ